MIVSLSTFQVQEKTDNEKQFHFVQVQEETDNEKQFHFVAPSSNVAVSLSIPGTSRKL